MVEEITSCCAQTQEEEHKRQNPGRSSMKQTLYRRVMTITPLKFIDCDEYSNSSLTSTCGSGTTLCLACQQLQLISQGLEGTAGWLC